MIRSIAVLSDTHGVLPCLEGVLRERDVEQADAVVVTGDLAAGPQPTQVLDRLLELGDRLVLVRGNADRDLVTATRGGQLPEGTPEIDLWAATTLSDAHIALLAGLPHPVTLTLEGVGAVLFCHGSPRDDNEVVLVDTRPSQWARALADVPDSVRIVCCGHTHVPFARLVDRRWVVNSGSIGMPYGSSGVPWTLLDAQGVHLRTTAIDPDQVARSIVEKSGFPDAAQWVHDYVLTPPSDLEALQAFATRDGRAQTWDS
ncbi:MAG TPA: metallophosphoesterase family protein [Humibacillus sp.]|nr:metallophosphoesterase family protein [Humibacillus sp.]